MIFETGFDKAVIEQRLKHDFTLSGQRDFEVFVKEDIQFYMTEFNVSYFWMVQLTLKVLDKQGVRSVFFEPELLGVGKN